MPIVGDGGGVVSYLHVEDAASATVAALDAGQGIYNIVDDEPAAFRALAALRRQRPRGRASAALPVWLARIAAGEAAVYLMTRHAVDRREGQGRTGLEACYPDWHAGFRAALSD